MTGVRAFLPYRDRPGTPPFGSIPAGEAHSSPSEPSRPSSYSLAPLDDHVLRAVDPVADPRPLDGSRERRRGGGERVHDPPERAQPAFGKPSPLVAGALEMGPQRALDAP